MATGNASGSANGTGTTSAAGSAGAMGDRSASAFIPRTVSAAERSVSTLVSRFAEPVRALGARTLGFVDRLMGPRLLAMSTPAAATPQAAGPSGLVWPVPWYQAPA